MNVIDNDKLDAHSDIDRTSMINQNKPAFKDIILASVVIIILLWLTSTLFYVK